MTVTVHPPPLTDLEQMNEDLREMTARLCVASLRKRYSCIRCSDLGCANCPLEEEELHR